MLTRITLALTRFISPIENSCSYPAGSQDQGRKKELKGSPKNAKFSKDSNSNDHSQAKEPTQPKLKWVSALSKGEGKLEDSNLFVQLNSFFRSLAPKNSTKSIVQIYKTATSRQKKTNRSEKGIIFDQTSNEEIE